MIDAEAPLAVSALLREDLVLPGLSAPDREAGLRTMAEALCGGVPGLEADLLYARLLERERLGPTALGQGVAVPHCRMPGLRGPAVLVAVSPDGVPFGPPEGPPVHVFFVVVSAAEDPGQNLRVLAAVSRLVRRAPRLPERLRTARTGPEILAAVREEEG
jgi:PTS system nitrogen regulatory IIA component